MSSSTSMATDVSSLSDDPASKLEQTWPVEVEEEDQKPCEYLSLLYVLGAFGEPVSKDFRSEGIDETAHVIAMISGFRGQIVPQPDTEAYARLCVHNLQRGKYEAPAETKNFQVYNRSHQKIALEYAAKWMKEWADRDDPRERERRREAKGKYVKLEEEVEREDFIHKATVKHVELQELANLSKDAVYVPVRRNPAQASRAQNGEGSANKALVIPKNAKFIDLTEDDAPSPNEFKREHGDFGIIDLLEDDEPSATKFKRELGEFGIIDLLEDDEPSPKKIKVDYGEAGARLWHPQAPALDPAFLVREGDRHIYGKSDAQFGRFVLRTAEQFTLEDIRHLRLGQNDLVELAQTHLGWDLNLFLAALMDKWTSAAKPSRRPNEPSRDYVETCTPCGFFLEDSYGHVRRSKMAKRGKGTAELGFLQRQGRSKGCPVLLKIMPGPFVTRFRFVDSRERPVDAENVGIVGPLTFSDYFYTGLRNYDQGDATACQKHNQNLLVWLARSRIHAWYTVQGAVDRNEVPIYCEVNKEKQFKAMVPLHTCMQMFGVTLKKKLVITVAKGIEADSLVPNRIILTGDVAKVSHDQGVPVHNREREPIGRSGPSATGSPNGRETLSADVAAPLRGPFADLDNQVVREWSLYRQGTIAEGDDDDIYGDDDRHKDYAEGDDDDDEEHENELFVTP